MTQSVRDFEKSKITSESFETKQFYVAQLDANGLLEVGEGPTDLIVGVMQNTPAIGEAGTYRFAGTSKVKLGTGGAAVGAWLTSDTDGRAIATTTDGNIVIGRALEAGDANDIIEVQLSIQHLYIA